eukprot:TRINITY_DN5569_c0_g1_i1.p1 TRINITY_DN5569_c0_g1~~TRINITY_DN5569_c0_g1_i1.p1  ORF type:complete len:119 (-),score=31.50 TRINITY_DN5569_c0_g1_i1:101-457(-)
MLRSLVGSEMCIRDRLALDRKALEAVLVLVRCGEGLGREKVPKPGRGGVCNILVCLAQLGMWRTSVQHEIVIRAVLGVVADTTRRSLEVKAATDAIAEMFQWGPVSYTHLTLPTKRIV